jgi:hypothetical protein
MWRVKDGQIDVKAIEYATDIAAEHSDVFALVYILNH